MSERKNGHDIDFFRGNIDPEKSKKSNNLEDSYTYSDFKFENKKVNKIPDVEKEYERNKKIEQQILEDERRLQEKRRTIAQQLENKEIAEEHFDYGYSSDPKIASGERKPLKPQSNNNFNRQEGGSRKMKPKKKRRGKNKLLVALIIFLLLGITAFGGLFAIKNFSSPVYFTIIGVDQRTGQDDSKTRADAIMSVGASAKDNKILMASIPRDTLTFIPCEGADDKITHAYVYGATNWGSKGGGPKCTTESVSQLVDISSNKYAKINFDNMVEMIDAVNGIDLKSTATFCEQDSKGKKGNPDLCFEKGKKYHMNGEQALAYSRHRKTDNDIQRGLRQQQVFKAIFRRVKTAKPWEWPGIYTKVTRMVETNLSQKEMLQVAMIYATGGTNDSHEFDWEGGWYGSMSVVKLSESSINEFTIKMKALR